MFSGGLHTWICVVVVFLGANPQMSSLALNFTAKLFSESFTRL